MKTRLLRTSIIIVVLIVAVAALWTLLSKPTRGEPDGVLKPGYGTQNLYIGMPEEQLGDGWQRVDYFNPKNIPTHLITTMYLYSPTGKSVTVREGRVHAIGYHKRNNPELRFLLPNGINESSDAWSILRSFGAPDQIIESVSYEPGESKVRFMYYREGIWFYFLNDKLSGIDLFAPTTSEDALGLPDVGEVERYRKFVEEFPVENETMGKAQIEGENKSK